MVFDFLAAGGYVRSRKCKLDRFSTLTVGLCTVEREIPINFYSPAIKMLEYKYMTMNSKARPQSREKSYQLRIIYISFSRIENITFQ